MSGWREWGAAGVGAPAVCHRPPRPLGVSADPPAQTILPKASQASQEDGFVANLPRLGVGSWSAGELVLTHPGKPSAHPLDSLKAPCQPDMLGRQHKGSLSCACQLPLLGCRVFQGKRGLSLNSPKLPSTALGAG